MKRTIILSGIPDGLEIYLADEESNWNERAYRKFHEEAGRYILEVDGKEGEEFKCFARTISLRRSACIKQLRAAGLNVTGKGSGFSRVWLFKPARVWFLIPRQEEYKGSGVWRNNVWGVETRITNIS